MSSSDKTPENSSASAPAAASTREIEWSELAEHNKDTDCWVSVNNSVYNVTSYLDDHPGGPLVIQKRAGKDATKQFEEATHSVNARKKLEGFKVGVIAKGSTPLPGQFSGEDSSLLVVGIALIGLIVAYILYTQFLQQPVADL